MIKSEKGITLIALIITIIVMLILVAVAVMFAMNGGLFKNAKDASAETEKKAIGETIFGSYILNNDGTINLTSTVSNARDALRADGKESEIAYSYPNANNPELIVLKVYGKTGTYYYEIKGGYELHVVELIEGEDEEENTILTGGEEEYVVTDDGEVTPRGGSSTPWYVLTDAEKGELERKGKATVVTEEMAEEMGISTGSIIYTIASDGHHEFLYLETTVPAEVVALNIDYDIEFFGADETNAAALEQYDITANAWLDKSDFEPYTGSCPIQLFELAYNGYCFCESYLTRVISSFGTLNWYDIQSIAEYNEIAENGGNNPFGNSDAKGVIIASDNLNFDTRTNDYIVLVGNAYLIVNLNGVGKYAYMINEAWGEQYYQKWFRFDDNSDDLDDITESAPPTITGNEFTTIYSQDYLDRLLEHI